MFDKEIIDRIKSSIDIVELVGRYVNLQKSGSYYRGLCPFHSDSDPSFYVSPGKQFFHCFGCGVSGDVITFYEKIENLPFSEAVEKLAEIAGIELPKKYSVRTEYDKYTQSLNILAEAYHKELLSGKHPDVLEYLLKERGFSEETLREFRIGFSPGNRTFLKKLVSNFGVKLEELLKAGVLVKKNSDYFDRFSKRIIIPIHNENGKVIGFGGRIIPGETGSKYINSPETRYFVKGRVLFNLHRAKKSVKELDYVVITEGYFDSMALYEAGIENNVGVLGTNLTRQHLKLLKTYTNNLLFLMDSDSAGKNATLRSLDLAESEGFSTAVAKITGTKDAGELFKNEGPKALVDTLKNAIPGAVFRVDYLALKVDITTPQGKQKLLEFLIPTLSRYLQRADNAGFQLTVKAISEKTNLPIKEIIAVAKGREKPQKILRERSTFKLKQIEKDLLSIYFGHPELRSEVARVVDFLETSEAFRYLVKFIKKNQDFNEIIDEIDEKIGPSLMEAVEYSTDISMARKMLKDIETHVDKKIIREQIEEIDRKLRKVIDPAMKESLMIRRMELTRLLKRTLKGGEADGR
ncbi:DNA primase [Kosmotoga sp.]|uniref:DNA primase n=1 Tax=Kosmotoga sp. TaxID=1955248 RepID=UPI0024AAC3CC|nr:DNA primase [Kosmotoga sp.]MDI3524006.1 primase [Kosmotoga sp.]